MHILYSVIYLVIYMYLNLFNRLVIMYGYNIFNNLGPYINSIQYFILFESYINIILPSYTNYLRPVFLRIFTHVLYALIILLYSALSTYM